MNSGFRQARNDEETGNMNNQNGSQQFGQNQNANQLFGQMQNTNQSYGQNQNASQLFGQNQNNTRQFGSNQNITLQNGQYQNNAYDNGQNLNISQPSGQNQNTNQQFGQNQNGTYPYVQNPNGSVPSRQNYNQNFSQPYGETQVQQGDPAFMNTKFDEQGDPRLLYADSLYLSFSGIIEAGECDDEESLRVEYSIKYSKEDWVYQNRTAGDTEPAGISQLSTSHNLHSKNIVWNFPFECNFKTTNPFGWPQVVVRLSGPDFMGRSVLKGYGSIHVPTTAGYHERTIRVYKPLPQSWFTGMLGYLLGNTAELKNFDRVISSGEGREVTRVRSVGYVKVKFHVTLVNFEKFGYM